MNHLNPPKLLNWKRQLGNCYECKQPVLITSGCSFTASTQQTESAASWPGFVKDRCNFDYCIDVSYPGAGNLYIKESIEYAVKHLASGLNPLVLVMWSGLQRDEIKKSGNVGKPYLNDTTYKRTKDTDVKKSKAAMLEQSVQLIQDLATFLEQKNISYAFTSFINLLHKPYIHCIDPTYRFTEYKDKQTVKQIEKLFLPIAGEKHLYDWAFINDGLSEDNFHPTLEANLIWTDQILLPSLEKNGLIKSTQERTM